MEDALKLYYWAGVNWEVIENQFGDPYAIARCPKNKCNCMLSKSTESYTYGEYKFCCVKCGFAVTLDKAMSLKGDDLLIIRDADRFKSAEIINIDGELIRIQKKEVKDGNYWVSASLSKNKKGDVQLMVLAGDRENRHKTQLFLDVAKERLAFDQNDSHPKEIFSKVEATFKNVKSIIESVNS